MSAASVAELLARAFLAGPHDPLLLVERGVKALRRKPRWLPQLAAKFAELPSPQFFDVVRLLRSHPGVQRCQLPLPALLAPGLPPIPTLGQLAQWLALALPDLDWFADLGSLNKSEALHHYRYTVITKRHGSQRLIEAPKPRLKAIQRQILTQILNGIPPHENAHGFIPGRSILSFATPHVGQPIVLRLDLDNFFPRLTRPRIQAFFRTLGYPKAVAQTLAGLCTNRAPRSLWTDWKYAQIYSPPHLPQGAPTSPAIANACMYRADCRLTGLAHAAGVRYTRYADDLAFSGPADFAPLRFAAHVAVILEEEGFIVNHRKTRVMRQGVRQHLAGLVTNDRLNVARDDYDRLKAILTNCIRHGPESQNREGHPSFREHLTGRVGFVAHVNPAKGAKLREILSHIDWQ